MPLTANPSGIVNGSFTIPAGIPVGTKSVRFTGAGGSTAEASFTGSGEIVTNIRQVITTVRQTFVDPLAQTFSLDAATQIAAVDLWFQAKGTSTILVQIREVSNGVPSSTVVAEARLKPADIVDLVGHTRVTFPAPIFLVGQTQYAIVALCDDAVAALRIAELGKFDSDAQRWVTSQPYTVGVLLSSSNNATWTAHQDRDMKFRLHRAVYAGVAEVVNLGVVPVVDATDLVVSAFIEQPGPQTGVEFILTIPGGAVITVSSGQPIRLPAPVTGDVAISARLTGDVNLGPVLFPGTELIVGTVQTSGTYITRAIKGGVGVRLKVIYNAALPGGSSVVVEYKGTDPGDVWALVPVVGTTPDDEGTTEISHELTGVTETLVQFRLTLNGSTAARPVVKNLIAMAL